MPSGEENTTLIAPVLSTRIPSQHLSEIISQDEQPQVQLRFTLAHFWLPHKSLTTGATIADLLIQIYSRPLVAQQRALREEHIARASANTAIAHLKGRITLWGGAVPLRPKSCYLVPQLQRWSVSTQYPHHFAS